MRTHDAGTRARGAAYGVLAAAFAARLAMAALIPLVPDETYYWEWSRHLAAGYLDHPPAIALLIRLGTAAFGASPFGVRFGSVVAGALASIVLVRISLALGGDRAMLRAAAIIACLPLAQVGLVLATPDAPLLLCWTLALAALIPAVRSDAGGRQPLVGWVLAGASLGLALSSKYTALLLLAGAALALITRPALRPLLATPGPYVGLTVALALFAPNVLWNARHEWASFDYQLAHGLAVHRGTALAHEARLLGGQLALISPLLLALLTAAVWRALRRQDDPVRTLFAIIASATWLAFVASALRSAVEPNWPAPAYLSAIALAAAHEGGRRWRQLLRAGLVLGAAITLFIYAQALHPFLPLAAASDPTAAGAGWDTLAAHVDRARTDAPPGVRSWVGGERYQEASELALHLANHPVTFAIDVRGRPNQYDLWPAFDRCAHRGDRLVLVLGLFTRPERDPVIAALAPYFDRVTLRDVVALRRGVSVRAWRRVWVLDGWRGSWPVARLAR